MMQPFGDQNSSNGSAHFVWGASSGVLGVTNIATLLPQVINIGHQVEKLACGLDFVAFVSA